MTPTTLLDPGGLVKILAPWGPPPRQLRVLSHGPLATFPTAATPAWRWLFLLAHDGVVREVEKGGCAKRRASRYR